MSEENGYQEAQAIGGFIKRHWTGIKLSLLGIAGLAVVLFLAAIVLR